MKPIAYGSPGWIRRLVIRGVLWGWGAAVGISIGMGLSLGGFSLQAVEESLVSPTTVVMLLWLPTVFVVAYVIGQKYNARHTECARRKGVCRRCGYALRGLPETRCPECGTPFEPGG